MPPEVAWKFQRLVWTLNFVGSALVIWRVCHLGLHKKYRYFLLYLALSFVRTAILLRFSPLSPAYYTIWSYTQPLLWISYVLVISELYSLALREYRGIYSLSRWFLLAAVSASVLVSALTVLPTMTRPPVRYPLLYYYALIERGLVTGLAIFLFLLLAMIAWFAIPLSRNLLIHGTIYTAYFVANNVTALYWAGAIQTTYLSNVSKLAVGLACQLCWVFFLTRRGEDRISSLLLGRNPLAERRLLGQLENLNATLLRTARK